MQLICHHLVLIVACFNVLHILGVYEGKVYSFTLAKSFIEDYNNKNSTEYKDIEEDIDDMVRNI